MCLCDLVAWFILSPSPHTVPCVCWQRGPISGTGPPWEPPWGRWIGCTAVPAGVWRPGVQHRPAVEQGHVRRHRGGCGRAAGTEVGSNIKPYMSPHAESQLGVTAVLGWGGAGLPALGREPARGRELVSLGTVVVCTWFCGRGVCAPCLPRCSISQG